MQSACGDRRAHLGAEPNASGFSTGTQSAHSAETKRPQCVRAPLRPRNTGGLGTDVHEPLPIVETRVILLSLVPTVDDRSSR